MGAIYHKGQPYSGQMVVDTDLSKVSNNPLKNRAITGLVDDVIAPVEGANASQAYSAGDELILNNLLYKANQAITQGTAFDAESGGNIELAGSIVEQLKYLFTGPLMHRAEYITNCNTSYNYPINGLKVYLTSSDALNRPISETGSFWILEFGSQGNLYAVQVAFQNSGGSMYMRRKSNGAWDTTWKQIYGDIADSLTFNANITNYANARIVNGMYWIHGLIAVNTAIAKNSTVVTFGKSLRPGGFVLNSMSTSVANQFVYANGTTGTNTQAQIPVGTYCIDTCFPITA